MKITIYTTQSSLDPSASVRTEEFPAILASYEKEIETEILKSYPNAEINFRNDSDQNWSLSYDGDDRDEVGRDLQEIMESVFETGNFW